jgi:hypothetical protein
VFVSTSGLTIVEIIYSWFRSRKDDSPDVTVVLKLESGRALDLSKVSPDELIDALRFAANLF